MPVILDNTSRDWALSVFDLPFTHSLTVFSVTPQQMAASVTNSCLGEVLPGSDS